MSNLLQKLGRFIRTTNPQYRLLRPTQYEEKGGFSGDDTIRQSEATLLESPFRAI